MVPTCLHSDILQIKPAWNTCNWASKYNCPLYLLQLQVPTLGFALPKIRFMVSFSCLQNSNQFLEFLFPEVSSNWSKRFHLLLLINSLKSFLLYEQTLTPAQLIFHIKCYKRFHNFRECSLNKNWLK